MFQSVDARLRVQLRRGDVGELEQFTAKSPAAAVKFAEKLLGEFDLVVQNSPSGSWYEALDRRLELSVTEPPLVDHSEYLFAEEDEDGEHEDDGEEPANATAPAPRWFRPKPWRWAELGHLNEQHRDWRQLEQLFAAERERLIHACILSMPALLAVAYEGDPARSVPVRYFWTLMGGRPSQAALSLFCRRLAPSQTASILCRAIRHGYSFLKSALEIPEESAAHVLGLLLCDDEVALRELLRTSLQKLGASPVTLGCWIHVAEQLLLKLGPQPFGIDDKRLHLETMARVAHDLFLVAADLGPSVATHPYVPRIRGLRAQLELLWPRTVYRSETPVLSNQSDWAGYGGHPSDWLYSALRELGCDEQSEDTGVLGPLPLRERIRRLENTEPFVRRANQAAGRRSLRGPAECTEAARCSTCHGAGLMPCNSCLGARKKPADPTLQSMQGWKKDPTHVWCSTCAATGRFLCWSCGGTGVVVSEGPEPRRWSRV